MNASIDHLQAPRLCLLVDARLLLLVEPALVLLALELGLAKHLGELVALQRVLGLESIAGALDLSESILDQRQLRVDLVRVLLSQGALELGEVLLVFDLQTNELLSRVLSFGFGARLLLLDALDASLLQLPSCRFLVSRLLQLFVELLFEFLRELAERRLDLDAEAANVRR